MESNQEPGEIVQEISQGSRPDKIVLKLPQGIKLWTTPLVSIVWLNLR